ncbi:MAG TPA: YggS family pyridoxal phosphate-dependent enzyme [Rhodanobacteraceae bacterium]|nr:YggS family pyridoxal phosphate-dependent enzyme [Rhodanobacteraceae bacterium]
MRWQVLRERVADACVQAGRAPDAARILPVSKTFGVDVVREAMALGMSRFGENRVQDIRAKASALAGSGIDWVMIGHLQTNKVKDVAPLVAEVQSLDRLELAQALDRRLQHAGRAIDVLVQVKTSPEPAKQGLAPADLPAFLRELSACASLRVSGLMTLAVQSPDRDAVRACFRRLRTLRDQAQAGGFELPRLSMGMSGDFGIAIAEGATEVRVGSALFGTRVAP